MTESPAKGLSAKKWSCLLFALVVTGCAQVAERVILLPSAGGQPSALVVKTEKGETVLAAPYATVEAGAGVTFQRVSSEQEIRGRYGPLLDALPPRSRSYVVHFYFGTPILTPESKTAMRRIAAEIAGLPAAEITVVGHTDRTGPEGINDPLSLRRAEVVRDALIAVGVPSRIIEVAGHGERELAVPTPAQVPEPKNRRAEIKVR